MARDGKFVLVEIDSIKILGQTSASLDFSVDMLETTDKDSKDPVTGVTDKTYIAGDRDGTFAIDFNSKDDPNGFPKLFTLFADGAAPVSIRWGGTLTGAKYYTCQGWLSGLTRTSGQNAIETASATFQKTGPVTELTVS